jgi:hypothetical protein
MQIPCPACKQRILVPTVEILESFQLLELGARAPFDEVKQAHLERIKAWHPDQFAKDPALEKQAAEKTKELNRALAIITAYQTGTSMPTAESRTSSKAQPERRPEQEEKHRASTEQRAQPKSTPPDLSRVLSRTRSPEMRSWLKWALVAAGVMLFVALLAGLVFEFLQRRGPSLTDESTGAQWIQAKERAKRVYSHAVLVEFEQKGMLRQSRLRVNDDFFYDGLEAVCRKQNPEDLNSKLVDLSAKLIGAQP